MPLKFKVLRVAEDLVDEETGQPIFEYTKSGENEVTISVPADATDEMIENAKKQISEAIG